MKIRKLKISIIGLGYVGLPLAVEFGKKYDVVGYDLNNKRVKELNKSFDSTNELSDENLKALKNLQITNNEFEISDSNIYIVTVPTPVDKNNKPDLNPIISASEMIGKYIKKDNIIIYESTVFPGCTEEICVPILEKFSKLKFNADFFCGYSPERINPGDKDNTLTKITKIVSGSNDKALKIINELYTSIIYAGTFQTKSIAVAEAAKVIENTQRDVNIALINELSLIFDKLNINTSEVLEAASTKWNFLPYKPGLVGGHCIGVDPYYLTHKAMEVGYHPEIILAGRRLNDNMGQFIVSKTISELAKKEINLIGAEVAILGLTFKENCPDLRNTKVITLIENLNEYHCKVTVSDCRANEKEAKDQFDIDLVHIDKVKNQDAIILAVSHEEYRSFNLKDWSNMLKPDGIIIDVKSIYNEKDFSETSFAHWSL